jgi:signal transduction histidine kinase
MRVAECLFGLFHRLQSAKDSSGTDVGLASVRRVVQRHGSEIWAESEPRCGAACTFTLAE